MDCTTLFFGLGGPAHVAALALLVAGVSAAALAANLVPRWFGVTSLVVAGLGGLSTFTLVTEAAAPLIPLGRFPMLIWLVAIAYLLPRGRDTVHEEAA